MELLKYCRNVANVKTLWYDEVVPKNHHPHLRLKHRRADAEHIRPETNPIQVSFRMEEYIMKKLSKRFLTLAIACVMAMAMAVPAFADQANADIVSYTGVPGTHPYRYTTTKETNINKQIVLNAYCEGAPVDGTPVTTWKYTGSDTQQWAGVGNVTITACYRPTNQYYSGDVINSDANPDVAINIYRSSTNSMPEVNLKNLIGNKFADVVITRNGTSYSVGPRAGIGTRYLQRTSSISNSGGGQYVRWGTTPSPFYAYDVPYKVFS
jgi:hypothetical protein